MSNLQAIPRNSAANDAISQLPGANVKQDRVRQAEMAKDFESLFLSLILKEMRQTLEPESLFAGDSGDIQGGMFDQFMSKHLTDAGGVGLAATILRQMQPESPSNVEQNRGTSRTVSGSSGT